MDISCEFHCTVDVLGEDRGAEPVGAVVGHRDRLVDVVEWRHRNCGPEQLLSGDAHVGGHVGDDGRVVHGALEATAVDGARARANGLIDPLVDPNGVLGPDHRSHLDRSVHRVAGAEPLDPLR